jgi:hypothetical protein
LILSDAKLFEDERSAAVVVSSFESVLRLSVCPEIGLS